MPRFSRKPDDIVFFDNEVQFVARPALHGWQIWRKIWGKWRQLPPGNRRIELSRIAQAIRDNQHDP